MSDDREHADSGIMGNMQARIKEYRGKLESSKALRKRQLEDLDVQIEQLNYKKQEIHRVSNFQDTITRMLLLSDKVENLIVETPRVPNVHADFVLESACTRLSSWRRNLPIQYFENTVHAIPESWPSTWTKQQATSCFDRITKALDEDRAYLLASAQELNDAQV
jgi:hypothetical protein